MLLKESKELIWKTSDEAGIPQPDLMGFQRSVTSVLDLAALLPQCHLCLFKGVGAGDACLDAV